MNYETTKYHVLLTDKGWRICIPKEPTPEQYKLIEMFYEASKLKQR